MPWGDKESAYFLTVSGSAPKPRYVEENGKTVLKAFTGYTLQGIKADGGGVDQLRKGEVFYPGDAIDLRDTDGSGKPLVKLSNDSFDGARYSELQLVPTFGTTSQGASKLYAAQVYTRENGSDVLLDATAVESTSSYSEPFFYAAPGLTVTSTENREGETLVKSGETCKYNSGLSALSEKASASDEVLKFIYTPPSPATLKVLVTWEFYDPARPDADGNPTLISSATSVNTSEPAAGWKVPLELSELPKGVTDASRLQWDTEYDYSVDGSKKITVGSTLTKPDWAVGCEPYPYEGVWEKLDPATLKTEGDPATIHGDEAVSQEITLEPGANVYRITAHMKCSQSITLYSQGDQKAFKDAGVPQPAPSASDPDSKLEPDDGPGDFMYLKDGGLDTSVGMMGKVGDKERMGFATRRYNLQSRLNTYGDNTGNFPYVGGFQPFHHYMDGSLLPTHVEPQWDHPTSTYVDANGDPIADKDKRDIKGIAEPLTVKNDVPTRDDSRRVSQIGVRQAQWLDPGTWAAMLTDHPGWGYSWNCPAGDLHHGPDGNVIGVDLNLGENVICYMELHTAEVSVILDVPEGKNITDWTPVFTRPSDMTAQAKPVDKTVSSLATLESCEDNGLDTNLDPVIDDTHKCSTLNVRPKYPDGYTLLDGKLALRVDAKSTLDGLFFKPRYFMYTGEEASPQVVNANLSADEVWTRMATQEEVNRAYGDKVPAANKDGHYLYKIISGSGGGLQVETDAGGHPKPYAPPAHARTVIKAQVIEVTMPQLPMTGGSAATTWLLLGCGLGTMALIGMALVRRRKAAVA